MDALVLRRRGGRLGRRLAMSAVAAALLVTAPGQLVAMAAGPPPPTPAAAPGVGVCVIVGTATARFSPALGVLPASITETIVGTGTCASNSLVQTISLNITNTGLHSCTLGEGTAAGQLGFSSGFPPTAAVTGQYVGTDPQVMTLIGGSLVAVATLAWSSTAAATCAVSGTVSTPLSGALVYLYA
jgi:hypothetical protein